MKRITAVSLLGFLSLTGCAYNSLVGHQSEREGVFFGTVGIRGDGNHMLIQNGSRVTELSLWGDDNQVIVEDQVTIGKIEFAGHNNTVSVPAPLTFRITQVGQNNRIIRRPLGALGPSRVPGYERVYAPLAAPSGTLGPEPMPVSPRPAPAAEGEEVFEPLRTSEPVPARPDEADFEPVY